MINFIIGSKEHKLGRVKELLFRTMGQKKKAGIAIIKGTVKVESYLITAIFTRDSLRTTSSTVLENINGRTVQAIRVNGSMI